MDALVRESIDYIRDVSSRYKNKTEREILELNKTINRLDIEKDAKASANMVDHTRPAYISAMNGLFPEVSAKNPLIQLGKIEGEIFKDTALGPRGIQHSWLKKPGKGYISSFMPEHIMNAYHDSGYNPKDIKQDFLTWVTPGSFIDPAGRDKPYMNGTAKFPAAGQITIPLVDFGFPGGTSFKATMLDDNQCRVEITIPGAGVVNIRRSKDFASMDLPDYFCGNSIKNAAINGTNDTGVIKKYTISKELSDFSQILFAIINMIRMKNEQEIYKHCIFTTDNVVAARSKFMGIQSCLQDHETTDDKSGHRVILYLAEMDPGASARELRISYLNACEKNNNTVKAHISKSIIQGFFIQSEQHFVGKGEMKDYLLGILDAIDVATNLAKALPLDGDENPDVYKKEILKYYAKTPINEKGRVLQSLQRLFVNCPELVEADIISKKRSTFGVILDGFIREKEQMERGQVARGSRRKTRKFLNLRKMRGGARNITDEELNSLFASEKDDVWDGTSIPFTPGSLLNHIFIIIQPENLEVFEDFIFRAFNHLLYICETPLDDRLLYVYREINDIENSELETFNINYTNYITNPELFVLARSRLMAARSDDPMEMLVDTEPKLTIDEINAGIEELRVAGELAPGVVDEVVSGVAGPDVVAPEILEPEPDVVAPEILEPEPDVAMVEDEDEILTNNESAPVVQRLPFSIGTATKVIQKEKESPTRFGPKSAKYRSTSFTKRQSLGKNPQITLAVERKSRKQRKSRRNTTWKRKERK